MRYLNRETRRSVRAQARNVDDLARIADQVWSAAQAFKSREEAARDSVREKMRRAGGEASAQLMRQWLRELGIDTWVHDIVDDGNRLGQHAVDLSGGAGFIRFPSCWTFVAYRLARVVQTVGERRRIQPSDLADAYHVASGPYADVLVTDDATLRAALGLVPAVLPFAWEPSEQFEAKF